MELTKSELYQVNVALRSRITALTSALRVNVADSATHNANKVSLAECKDIERKVYEAYRAAI